MGMHLDSYWGGSWDRLGTLGVRGNCLGEVPEGGLEKVLGEVLGEFTGWVIGEILGDNIWEGPRQLLWPRPHGCL